MAKATVPSYYMIRTNLPQRKPQNQWEGVYYFSGITKRQRHLILLQRKRERMQALQSFEAHQQHLLHVWSAMNSSSSSSSMPPQSITPMTQTWEPPTSGAEDALHSIDHYLSQHPSHSRRVLQFSCQLASAGLHREAVQAVRAVESMAASAVGPPHRALSSTNSHDSAPSFSLGTPWKPLQATDYVTILQHFPARRLQECLLHADATGDPALTYKLLGDRGGEERAREAYELFEMGLAQLSNAAVSSSSSSASASYASTVATQLMNHLMETLLTCGYRHVLAVSSTLYDRMGVWRMSPTATTYQHVLTSLALTGNMREAEEVHQFLSRHLRPSDSSVAMKAGRGDTESARTGLLSLPSTPSASIADNMIKSYDALLLGYREAKAFDQCDRVWEELVDRRWPRAAVSTAELYLRSVMDHAVTPVSEPLQRFGDLNIVAKKKVPVILMQMEELGIPRGQLSPPLQDEVEDALRKFSIHREKFYEWGRAVKQFDFIEFRRRHGWMYDLHLMKQTTKMLPPVRDPSQPNAALAPAAVAELPAFFNDKYPWEKDAMEELLFVQEEKERVDDVRSGDIYYDEKKSLHERSSTWMTEVPETRYDQLYGISHPDIAKIGIRQHLQGEYTNKKELLDRDAALMRKTLHRGRRLRHRAEIFRTHRQESAGSIPPASY